MTDAAGELTTFQYDAAGRLKLQTAANGVRTSQSYNAAGWVTAIEHLKTDNSRLASFTYTYDNVGNRTHVAEHGGGAEQGDRLRVPELPAEDNSRPRSSNRQRKDVDWTEWEVLMVAGTAMQVKLVSADEYPKTGGFPILNEEGEVVGIYVATGHDWNTHQPQAGLAHTVAGIRAALERAQISVEAESPE